MSATSTPRSGALALAAFALAVPLGAAPAAAAPLAPPALGAASPVRLASAVAAAQRPPVTGGRKGLVETRLAAKGRSTGEFLESGAVTTDAQGRVIVAGSDWNFLVVMRYRKNGKPDRSFGTQGVVRVRLGKAEVVANEVVVDAKGRVVVAAASNAYAHDPRARVVRLTKKGKLDRKFAKKGVFSTKNATARGLAVDGKKIVVVGRSTTPSGAWVTKLSAKGKVVKKFGTKGVVRLSKYGDEENERVGTSATDVLLDERGRIVVHLSVFLGMVSGAEFGLARLLPTGELDPEFYGGGWDTQRYIAPEGDRLDVSAAGLAALPDGGYVTAGGMDGEFTLYRYGADGEPLGRAAMRSVSEHLDERAVAVAIDPKGRIVSAGTGTQRLGLTRYSARFEPTPGFGAGGAVLRRVPGYREVRVADLTIDPRGRLVVAATGHPKKFSKKRAVLVFRYTAKGTPHAAWGR